MMEASTTLQLIQRFYDPSLGGGGGGGGVGGCGWCDLISLSLPLKGDH